MEMRKFLVELHPGRRVTCCEYEDSRDIRKSAWSAGYRQAVARCNEQVELLGTLKDTCIRAKYMYQGAAQVRDVVASCYRKYSNK